MAEKSEGLELGPVNKGEELGLDPVNKRDGLGLAPGLGQLWGDFEAAFDELLINFQLTLS